MRSHIVVYKEIGETPLQAIEKWQERCPEYQTVPATYAGRLDPMASGKLLVLIGDACKEKDTYMKLDKEYEIEVLIDISTDTGDVLGMPVYSGNQTILTRPTLASALKSVLGTHSVPYPAYSSKTVAGKPLFLYALDGTLDSIEIPTHSETIYSISILSSDRKKVMLADMHVPKKDVRMRIKELLSHAPRSTEPTKALGADFRQDEIKKQWEELFDTMPERTFTILKLKVTCASGTYMRTLASRIASELGSTGLALSIRRTRIGQRFSLLGHSFWIREVSSPLFAFRQPARLKNRPIP